MFRQALGLGSGDRAAVVGCGGKTSLIGRLALEFGGPTAPVRQRVLIATTTKMFPPFGIADRFLYNLDSAAHAEPLPGIDCAGTFDPSSGKVCPPPDGLLPALAARYDIALIESDGSRGLPLKGWRDDEPVVPNFSTCTIGVVPANALGLAADESNVLRLGAFLRITGLSAGETVQAGHIARMILHPEGMFRGSVGRRILFINQAENVRTRRNAMQLRAALRQNRTQDDFFERICMGSVRSGACQVIDQP